MLHSLTVCELLNDITVMAHSLHPHWLANLCAVGFLLSPICLIIIKFLGNIAGFSFPLFTSGMFDKLGYNWANTLFGFIAVLLAPVPFVSHSHPTVCLRLILWEIGAVPLRPSNTRTEYILESCY